MPTDDRAKDDISALIEADLTVSGARTPREMREALVASAMSLLRRPDPVVQISEVGSNEVRVSVTLSAPSWPGQRNG